MDTLLNFIATNLYGMALLLLPIYGLIRLLKKFFPRCPDPLNVVIALAVLGVFTLATLPRILFEQKVMAGLAENKALKLVGYNRWGHIGEPITWFYTPIGAFHIVGPCGQSGEYYRKENPRNCLKSLRFRYGKDPEVEARLVDVNCKDRTIHMSEPDANGTFRYQTKSPRDLYAIEYKEFCEEDFSAQMTELRQQILNYSNQTRQRLNDK